MATRRNLILVVNFFIAVRALILALIAQPNYKTNLCFVRETEKLQARSDVSLLFSFLNCFHQFFLSKTTITTTTKPGVTHEHQTTVGLVPISYSETT